MRLADMFALVWLLALLLCALLAPFVMLGVIMSYFWGLM